jgi:hypothetical protein
MKNTANKIGQNLHNRDNLNAAEFRQMMAERERAGGKFNNVSTLVDGYRFDSKKEAQYYGGLKMRKIGGAIKGFSVHPVYRLEINNVLICTYEADFEVLENDGTKTVVDVKGEATANLYTFRIKQNLMLALLGIKILVAK